MRHIIPISGKDSLTTYIVSQAIYEHDFEVIYNNVGAEPPEIFEWLERVEKHFNIEIQHIGYNLEQEIINTGMLPNFNFRYCTRKAKIKPMNNFFGKDKVTLYYGIRYDEQNRKGLTPNKNQTVIYPLIDNKIDINAVYAILNSDKYKHLLPPTFFWKTLADRFEDKGHLLEKVPQEVKDILFAGRSRPNCFFCFYQRQYEWIWLNETHPDLWEKAVWLENNVGGNKFYWNKGKSLNDLLDNKEKIIQRRVNQITKHLENIQELILQNKINFSIDEIIDDLSVTSCGLNCGK